MITADIKSGIAIDYARIYKGTESEPDEDGTEVVLTMSIGEDSDIILGWASGTGRSKTQMFIPLERLKKIIDEV